MTMTREPNRDGSMMVEVAVAMTLMVATIAALGKFSFTATQMQLQHRAALSAELALDNVTERLHGLSKEQVEEFSKSLSPDSPTVCGCYVSIDAVEIAVRNTDAVRAEITVTLPSNPQVTTPPPAMTTTRWWPIAKNVNEPSEPDSSKEDAEEQP